MAQLRLNNWPTPLRVVWRCRWRFAAPAVGVFVLVWFGSLFVPRSYEAQARFRRSNDAVLAHAAGGASDAAIAPMRRTLEQDIKGKAALEALLDDESLPFAERFDRSEEGELTTAGRRTRARLIDGLADRIDVTTAVSSDAVDVVVVTVRDHDPDLAAELANRLVERYLVTARQRLTDQLAEAEAFFTRQIELQQDKLAGLRLDKLRLEQENPALRASEAAVARDNLIGARAELRSIDQQLLQLDQEHDALGKWLEEQPDHLEQRTRGRNPQVAQLQAQKAQLEQELSEHRYKWGRTDEHPLVQKTLAKIAALDSKLKQTPAIIDLTAQRRENPAKLEAQARLESLSAMRRTLRARRDTLASEVEQLTSQQQVEFLGRDAYEDAAHQIAAAQREVDFWQSKRREVTLARSAGGMGLSMLDRAAAPRAASFPPPGGPTLIALLAGVLAGLATVIVTRATDRSIDSVEAAQRTLDLPVLGAIAEVVEPVSRPRPALREAA